MGGSLLPYAEGDRFVSNQPERFASVCTLGRHGERVSSMKGSTVFGKKSFRSESSPNVLKFTPNELETLRGSK